MHSDQMDNRSGDEGQGSTDDHEKKVQIEVDNREERIRAGSYAVSRLKEIVKVPADKDLDQVVNGILTPLEDTATVIISGGEVFFSHVRRGGSS